MTKEVKGTRQEMREEISEERKGEEGKRWMKMRKKSSGKKRKINRGRSKRSQRKKRIRERKVEERGTKSCWIMLFHEAADLHISLRCCFMFLN